MTVTVKVSKKHKAFSWLWHAMMVVVLTCHQQDIFYKTKNASFLAHTHNRQLE